MGNLKVTPISGKDRMVTPLWNREKAPSKCHLTRVKMQTGAAASAARQHPLQHSVNDYPEK